MNKSYKLFIFDFDGTIGDTKEGIFTSFQDTFSKNGLPPVNREQVFSYMGLHLKEIFKKLTFDKYNAEVFLRKIEDSEVTEEEKDYAKTLEEIGKSELEKLRSQSQQ